MAVGVLRTIALRVAVFLALCLVVFAAPGVALAAETPPEPTLAPATAPTITGPSAGTFIGNATTTVSGTRGALQEIQLLSPTGGDPLCIVAAGATTAWSCPGVRLPSGPSVTLRAVVTGQPTLAHEITVSVLAAPVVTGGPSGRSVSNGIVRGTGYPGATITVGLSGGRVCTSSADSSGAWWCLFEGQLVNGSREVTASQQTNFSSPSSSNSSAPVTVVFDVDRPAVPTVTSPVNGAQVPVAGATYSGHGESGATVTVFAGAYSVCTATVTDGAWSCSAGGVAAGSYVVKAVQQDAAGNVSPGSTAITVAYAAPPAPAGPASPAPSDVRTPPSAVAVPPAPSETPQATPSPTATEDADQGDPAAAAPTRPPGSWSDPTGFTGAVTPPWSSAPFPWLQAVLMAFGAVLLLALPARLLAGTISRSRGGRPFWSAGPIAGRNRAREEFETAPTVRLNRWLMGGGALVAAAALVMLSGPVADRPAYLRLLVAVVVALIVVNAVGGLVPLWWSSRVLREKASVTFLPRYLLLVGSSALASRVFEIEPALLFGLLGSVAVVASPTVARRGQLAAARAGSLILLAVVAWFVLGALPAATGFLSALAAETANTVVLAAIGSAVLILVPIGKTSGRSILSWSPPIWAALMVLAFAVMFALLSPVVGAWAGDGTVTLLWVSTVVFAALSVGAWAWQRFVVPALR